MKISIITASYNYEQYIAKCIESVIAQTYQNWELIIVDDGSSDNSVEIIKSYCEKDNRIKLFQHADCEQRAKRLAGGQGVADPFSASNQVGGANKGLKETILLGLQHSTGDWIAFLESDDAFKPNNLLKKIEAIEKNPDVKLVFNKVEFLRDKTRPDYNQKEFEDTQNKLSKMAFPKNMFYDFYIKNMILTFSSVMVEKKALMSTSFETPTDAFLDWWLWIHLAYKNEFYYLDEDLTVWNLHSQSYIKTAKKPFLAQLDTYADVYKNEGKEPKILLFIFGFLPILLINKMKKFIFKNLISAR